MLVCTVIALAGCNNSATSEPGGNGGGGEKVQLTMQAWGNPAELKVYQRAVDGFMEENPNIEVKLVPVASDQYEQKLMTSLQGNKGPDVFYAFEQTMPELIDAGKVQSLNDFFSTDESYVKLEDFPEGLFGPAKENDEVYAVAPDANPLVIYYNKSVFKEAGVKTPQEYYDEGNWNWKAFEEVTSQLKEAGKEGLVLENWWAHWYSWVWSNGGQIYDKDGNFVFGENEKAQEAFKFLEKLVKKGNAVYAGSLPQGQGVDAMFMSNQVGMVSGGRWFSPQFNENKSLDYDYIYYPSNTENVQEPVGVPVAYLAANADGDHKDEAQKFISYYVGQEGQELRTGEGGSALPSLPAADENALASIDEDKHFNFLLDARDNGFTHGSNLAATAKYPALYSDLEETIDLMMLGKAGSEETIDKIVELAEKHSE